MVVAGEWIQLDINLYEKPEVQEIIDLTATTIEQVVYRLFRLWGWASLNTTDGTLAGSEGTLIRMFGGDKAFWEAVQSVGWIKFTTKKITITSWDKRFSKGAKARIMDNRSKATRRMSGQQPDKSRTTTGQDPSKKGTRGEEKRREEIREEDKSSCSETAAPPPEPNKAKRYNPPAVVDNTPVLYLVPVIGDPANPLWNLTRGLLDELSRFYPGHSVERSIRSAVAWIAANPEKRKTAKGMRRFLTGWIEREVNRTGSSVGFKSAQEKRMLSISEAPAILDGLKATQADQFDFGGTFGS